MKKKILKDTTCEACGSWEFECRDDGELYCNSCSLPVVKSEKEQAFEYQYYSRKKGDFDGDK
jgi:uncharacterized Zn finger protein (UPF0148 family)